MKNSVFCALSVVLMGAVFTFGLSVLHSGEGAAVLASARIAASRNSDKISGISAVAYEKKQVVLPETPRKLTAADLDSIMIDGKEVAFPIRLKELPDGFGYALLNSGKNAKGGDEYTCTATLNYNGSMIATVHSYNSENAEEAVFTDIAFPFETNRYIPEITVAGIDVFDADMRELNRIYGYDSDEYGYDELSAETADGAYKLYISDSRISRLSYTDSVSAVGIRFYKDEIKLPEGYTIEADSVNSAMEYIPITEKNEEFQSVMDIVMPREKGYVQLPCTLNALMMSLDENAVFEPDKIPVTNEEYGCYIAYGEIRFNENSNIDITLLMTPERPVGEAQVISISYSAGSELWELLDIDGENPYGFSEKTYSYLLTDMIYNNFEIEHEDRVSSKVFVDKATLSYWGENTEKTE